MGKIIVTGASGQFGSAAAGMLLEQVAAEDLVLLSRTPENLANFAETGAQVRRADFDDPGSLLAAMEGGERMLLISTVRVGSRVEQHTNAVEAARAAGEARGVGVVRHQPADALVALPDVGVLEDLLAHHAVFGEAGDQRLRVTGVERPRVGGDQVLQAEAVLDG